MPSFNLITEKWISCILPGGKVDDMSLQDVLAQAHEIMEVYDPSPLVTVSLHRLLLAILHRNFGPANLQVWKSLWDLRHLDVNKLSDYFTKWYQRFDLFDQNRPFYQTPEIYKAERQPVLRLAMEASTGNNATLFDHNIDSAPATVSPAEAARYLITSQSYAIGLGKSQPFYFSDSPLIRGMTTLLLGKTLFQTLVLNLVVYNDERPFPRFGEDIPTWERDKPVEPDKDGTLICGYVDYLTWQSRRIHLLPECDPISVRYCQIQQNLKLPKQEILDPFKCFKRNEERGFSPLNVSKDKSLWRDSHTLFQTVDTNLKRPEIFNFLARIKLEHHNEKFGLQPVYKLALTGLATDAGKAASVVLWRHERLPLPLTYLEDENLIAALKEALDIAEAVGRLLLPGFFDREKKCPRPLQLLASALLPLDNNGKPDNDAVGSIVEHLALSRSYWSRLGILFNKLLLDIAEDKTVAQHGQDAYGTTTLPWWAKEVRNSANNAFEGATRSLDQTARTLKAITKAEQIFKSRLYTIVSPYLNAQNKMEEVNFE